MRGPGHWGERRWDRGAARKVTDEIGGRAEGARVTAVLPAAHLAPVTGLGLAQQIDTTRSSRRAGRWPYHESDDAAPTWPTPC